MDKWAQILLDIDEMWDSSFEKQKLKTLLPSAQYYQIGYEYKIQRIYDLYGHEYAMRYIKEMCPENFQPIFIDRLPCQLTGNQCNLECTFYKGGCVLCQ